MAWTATLISVEKKQGMVFPLVRFSNATETFDQTFQADDIDATKLGVLIARRLASIASRDTAAATLTPGPVTPPDLTPTQVEQDAAAFFVNLAKLKAFDDANSRGLLDATQQTTLATFRGTVKASFKAAYLTDPRWR